MDPIGFDLDGVFQTLPNTIKPLIKESYELHIYQGPYYECSKNILLGTVTLPYQEVWDLSYCLRGDKCYIMLDNKPLFICMVSNKIWRTTIKKTTNYGIINKKENRLHQLYS